MEDRNQGWYSTFEIRVRAVEAVSRGLPVGDVADAFGINRPTLFFGGLDDMMQMACLDLSEKR